MCLSRPTSQATIPSLEPTPGAHHATHHATLRAPFPPSWGPLTPLTVTTDLEAQAAAVEAGLVHGGVLPDETAAQLPVLQGDELVVVVVMQQPLGQVEQGAQLAQGAAVGLHLPRVMRSTEEDATAVGADVAPLVDDVENAAAHHL